MGAIKGNVFDVQRYSIHDGHGIRTIVFLKGCPLRCKWCANPESWTPQPQLFYSKTKCIQCKTCVQACPNGEVTDIKDQGIQICWEKCRDGALDWVEQCPTGALSIKGSGMGLEEAVAEVKKDIAFYKQSRGGITVSGGEPFVQEEFVNAFLKRCKEEGIHTAVETTGCIEWSVLQGALDYVDLFLYDIKSMDTAVHKRWTGVGNERILTNLRLLAEAKKDIMVRTPLIPGVNDNKKEIIEIMKALKLWGIRKYAILPFHQYGSKKYSSTGLEYPLQDLKAPDKRVVKEIEKMIEEEGFQREFQ